MNIITPHLFRVVYAKTFKLGIVLTFIFFVLGLFFALYASPEDYQQGGFVRIMYVHVPAAWMSLAIYSLIALFSLGVFVWKNSFCYLTNIALAPIGAAFTFITLATGSIWGKPMWGAWWVWDARLTSMFVLFLLYISYIAIISAAGNNILKAQKPASALAILGFVNIPIVKFSVDIWYSLHQPASVFKAGGPAIDKSMLIPLILMFVAFALYGWVVTMIRLNKIIQKTKEENRI